MKRATRVSLHFASSPTDESYLALHAAVCDIFLDQALYPCTLSWVANGQGFLVVTDTYHARDAADALDSWESVLDQDEQRRGRWIDVSLLVSRVRA